MCILALVPFEYLKFPRRGYFFVSTTSLESPPVGVICRWRGWELEPVDCAFPPIGESDLLTGRGFGDCRIECRCRFRALPPTVFHLVTVFPRCTVRLWTSWKLLSLAGVGYDTHPRDGALGEWIELHVCIVVG